MIYRYSSRREKLDQSFLNKRLTGARAYDRIAGYFRSSMLEVAGEALESVTGNVRVVCNSDLSLRDVIEGYHRQLRKVTKTKTAYPTDDALKKIIYLATVEAAKKWTMPVKDWKNCISQFAIYFGDRLETELAI